MRKWRWKSSPRPSTSIAAGNPEVFELTTASGRRTRSMRAYTSCLMSSRSTTASTIQSTSPSMSKSSSVLPTVTSRASRGEKKAGAGLAFSALSSPLCAMRLRAARSWLSWASGGTTSSSSTGMPALAMFAAMPAPMMPAPITAARRMFKPIRAPLQPLEDGSNALATAHAEGRHAEPPAAGLEIVQQCRDEAATRGAERMTQRDGAAVRVQLILVDAQLAHHSQRLRRECLVELDHINVGELQVGARERPAHRFDRSNAHDLRRDARHRHGQHARSRRHAHRARLFSRHQHSARRAVVEWAAVAGGDGAARDERRLQPRQLVPPRISPPAL